MDAVAGHDEIAESAEPAKGFLFRPEGNAEAGHLGEGAGDHGGLGIVAEAESVDGPGGDREDVFHHSAELDPHDITAGVSAEPGQGKDLLHLRRDEGIGRSDRGEGGHAAGYFFGMARA